MLPGSNKEIKHTADKPAAGEEMSDPKDSLHAITDTTLAHYTHNAQSFWEGTRDHDVSQNITALLNALGDGSHRILDLGCGPGRDLRTFSDLGHRPTGLDGSATFCEMARTWSGCPVLHQNFLDMRLPEKMFDGVFANASLFHVPTSALPHVLRVLHAALRSDGILFCSNPRGNNQEGWNGSRYGAYHDLGNWRAVMASAGFVEIHHYYRPPGLPREHQPWLASVWRAEKE